MAFIYHTLWQPRSPALEQPGIQVEVRNLEEAFEKITAVDHPKYFKILSPPNETSVIEAYRFPTIIQLAKLTISNRGNCAYEFHVSPEVSRLKKIHDKGVQGPTQLSTPSREMQYNIEIEAEFVEEVMAYGLPAGLRCFKDIEEYADDLVESMNLNSYIT